MRVGDAGAVLLVGGHALITHAQSALTLRVWGANSGVLQLCSLLTVEGRGTICGDFLPLEPAGQRRVALEVEVPGAAVLLGDLLHPQLQVSAQLLVVHRAEQTPADRLSAPDGLHASTPAGLLEGKV